MLVFFSPPLVSEFSLCAYISRALPPDIKVTRCTPPPFMARASYFYHLHRLLLNACLSCIKLFCKMPFSASSYAASLQSSSFSPFRSNGHPPPTHPFSPTPHPTFCPHHHRLSPTPSSHTPSSQRFQHPRRKAEN